MSHATQNDIKLLNASLGGEYFGIAAYQAAIGTGLLDEQVRAVAEKFQNDHRQHAMKIEATIRDLGADPIVSKTWEQYAEDYPPPPLQTQVDILRYAASLEESAASGSVESIGQLASPELAQLTASIAGVEAMHWSILLGALGENPSPVSFIPVPDVQAQS